MISFFLNPDNVNSAYQRLRYKRFQFFKLFLDKLPRPIHILDVGGTEVYWKNMGFTEADAIFVTLLNLSQTDVTLNGFTSVIGNACDLSEYSDKYFDIVFSNSVIEHLFTFENQALMAKEIQRVGKNYLVQTPYRYFPIEPHWLFPMFQFLPFSLKVYLTNNFSIGRYPKALNSKAAINRVKEVRLLKKREMLSLFPNGRLYEEKFLGLTKSLTMYKFD